MPMSSIKSFNTKVTLNLISIEDIQRDWLKLAMETKFLCAKLLA